MVQTNKKIPSNKSPTSQSTFVQVRFVLLDFFEDDAIARPQSVIKSWLPHSCCTFCACFASYLPSPNGK